MKKEVVLVLSHRKPFAKTLKKRLYDAGVERIHVTEGSEVSLQLPLVTTLIVDKTFSQNAEATARYLEAIRSMLRCPIIGFEISAGGGDLNALQAAGCKSVVRPTNGFDQDAEALSEDLCNSLCKELELIRSERASSPS